MENKKFQFADMKEMIESVRKVGMIKFGYDPSKIIKKSKILESIKTQTNLQKWF
jgi:hypothetical protein